MTTQGRGEVVYNPHGKPIDELPLIMGFNNGGSPGWYQAVAVAEDGVVLGGHVCSHDCYMPHDLGIIEGSRLDRHENSYRKHYPEGYRMEFIPQCALDGHPKLQAAIKAAKERDKASEICEPKEAGLPELPNEPIPPTEQIAREE